MPSKSCGLLQRRRGYPGSAYGRPGHDRKENQQLELCLGDSLGRGLISPQPKANRGTLDEGEVVDSEPVIAGGDAAALLDLVEKPLDQITRPVEMGAEADGVLAVHLRGYVGPSALLVYERSDLVGIVATIRQHHRSRAQSGQKHRTEPIVMSLARREAEAHG